jgi:hypothetical protein
MLGKQRRQMLRLKDNLVDDDAASLDLPQCRDD